MAGYAAVSVGEMTSPAGSERVPPLVSSAVAVMALANMLEAHVAEAYHIAAAGSGSAGEVCDERRAEDHG